jgi:hypothetical protein
MVHTAVPSKVEDPTSVQQVHLSAACRVRSFKQDVAEADLLGQEVRASFRAACSQLAAAALAVSAAAPPPEGKDHLEVGRLGIAVMCARVMRFDPATADPQHVKSQNEP